MLKDENEINFSQEKLKEMIAACVGPEKEEFLFGSTSSTILREAKDCSIWVIQ